MFCAKGGESYAKSLMHYIIEQTEGEKVDELVELAQDYLSPKLGENTMTFAEQWMKRLLTAHTIEEVFS